MNKIIISIFLMFLFVESHALASCSLSIQRDLSFGDYDPLSSSSNNSTGRIKIKCTGSGSVSYEVLLSQGQAGSYYPRAMLLSGGGAQLNYNIYTNNRRTKIWGDGSGSTYTITKTKSSPFTKRHTAYGEIPGSQSAASIGTYNDTITVTLNY